MRYRKTSAPDAALEVCFYCGATVAKDNVEWDHFPIPKNMGGTQVVAACVTCHDLKDRIRFSNWSSELASELLFEISRYGRATKLYLAKMLRIAIREERSEVSEQPL